MTENEAKAVRFIENIKNHAMVTLDHITKEEPNVSPLVYKGREEKADTILTMIEELKQYREIGTLEECKAAVEKQTKKNLIFDKPLMVLSCPICGHYAQEVVDDDGSTRGNIPKYCSRCGQKLDCCGMEAATNQEGER